MLKKFPFVLSCRLLCIGLALFCYLPAWAQWDDEGWGGEHIYTMTRKELKAKIKAEREKLEGPDTAQVHRTYWVMGEVSGAFRSGDRIPFYMSANEHGVLSPEHNQGYARVKGAFRTLYKSWSAEVGADVLGYVSNESDYYGYRAYVQQLYAKFSYNKYRLVLGAKEEPGEFVDPKLSSGNMVLSGNARPGVGVDLGMDDFSQMVIVDNYLEGKFNVRWYRLTDGRFSRRRYREYEATTLLTDGRQHSYVGNAWLHHKSVFVRTKSSWPFFLTAGIEHACMYAGTVNGEDNSQSHGWFMAMFGSKGKKPAGYNHVLSYDFRGDLNFETWDLGFYKQHYSDDMEGGLFESGKDGLWGMELKLARFPWLEHLVVEMLFTTNQNGVVYANDVYRYTGEFVPEAGNSNFYHDEDYGAWANYYMGLGNPLLMSPIYNEDHYPDYASNMIEALHIGMQGKLGKRVDYLLKFHHQESWGSPFAPYVKTKKNTSLYMAFDVWYKNFQFVPSVSIDQGDLLGNNIGFRLKVRYHL